MQNPIRIENWSLSEDMDNPYQAPECRAVRLHGDVFGHPRLGNMEGVITSSIKDVDGDLVWTSSGSLYLLGKPSPAYVEWCKAEGHYVPTAEQPIKTKV